MDNRVRSKQNNAEVSTVSVAPVATPASIKDQVSAAEWQTRVDLAACYRLVAMHGWDDLIFTHISAKVPGTEDFLINPYGLMFHEISASSLVKVDLAGHKLMDSPYEINPAGYTIHSAVHEVRHDVSCVLHTHTAAGVAVSAQRQGVLPISQQSLFVLSSLAYHAYEGVALNHEEKARLQADLGSNNFLMLHNHGLLTCGASIADTFLMMFVFQRACDIQVLAQNGGAQLIAIEPQVLAGAKAMIAGVTRSAQGMGGALAWPALLRKLDQQDPGFRV
nr:class II aldolase/adducin family protein [Pseudomonas agarici]